MSFIDSLEGRRLFTAAVPVFINTGGASFINSVGQTFAADANFTGGTAGQSSPLDVQGTSDDGLFLDYRQGNSFSYAIPVVNGHYALWLEFADPTFATAGQRTFNVSAESASILTGFDIAQAAGGSNIAIAKCFDVTVTDGTLNLAFTGVVNSALVSAIAVVPTDIPDVALPYTTLPLSDSAKVTASLANLRYIGQNMLLYANENKGKFPPDLPTLRQTIFLDEKSVANPRASTPLPRGETTDLEEAAWIASRKDYIYLGAGKKESGPADAVLAYENPDRENGDIGILWGDGHASTMDRASAAALIGFPNSPPSDPPPAPPTIPPADPNVLASQQNLHALSTAMQNYSNNNKGRYPVDLGTLFDQNYITDIHVFINPRGTTQPPPDSASKADKVAWIDASSDYLFEWPGQRTGLPPWKFLLSENPAQMADGLDQLNGSGLVDFRETRWATETLRQTRPSILSSSLNTTSGATGVRFSFNPPGLSAATVTAGDLSILNLNSNQPVATSDMSVIYNVLTPSFTFAFSPSMFASLADGNYRATLAAASVADGFGNPLPANATVDFFLLAGDANHDGIVNTSDFAAMANNFNAFGGTSLSQGDVNGDGRVNAMDFNLIATRFGASLSSQPISAVLLSRSNATPSLFAARPIAASSLAGMLSDYNAAVTD